MNPSYPDANSPYGDGTESDAGVVALGEMWGNTMECIYADRHYQNGGAKNSFAQGQGGFTENIQGIEWPNDIGGLNAYLRAIENFNPNLNGDLDRWIPMGLPNDLRDDRNDFNFPGPNVNDGVNVYTIQQLFLALQPDVRTVPAFRDRLLLQNGNNQSVEVNTLFNAYHY
jgi:hypothetical protein